MKFLKSDQVYYSLDKDADYCARAVADLIRADSRARNDQWGRQERERRQAEIFGVRVGKAFDNFVNEAVNKILNMKWEL